MTANGTTKLELTLIRETEKARYYENARGKRQWVPRSVCPRTLKIGKTHEVAIEDWWLAENPFEVKAQKQKDLF